MDWTGAVELRKAQNPLDTFSRNFLVDGEVANLLRTCCELVVYVADLLRTCYGKTGVIDFGLNAPLVLQNGVVTVTVTVTETVS